MAFQNALTSYKQEINIAVASLDAGPDRFQICDPDGTLTAAVTFLPGDPFTHTFEWVQMSGNPVTWITPLTNLTVAYTALDTPDRVFRIYADKGTAVERYDDVTVFGTPTSDLLSSQHTNSASVITCRSVVVSYLPVASSIGSLELTSSYKLTWTNPTCDYSPYFVEFHIQRKYQTGPWINLGVVPKGATREFFTSVTSGLFRILAVYSDGGNYGSNWINDQSVGKTGILTSDLTSSTESATSISTYKVDILTLFTNEVVSPLTSSTESATSISTYKIDILTLSTLETPISDLTSSTESATSISTYKIDALTGIEIGG